MQSTRTRISQTIRDYCSHAMRSECPRSHQLKRRLIFDTHERKVSSTSRTTTARLPRKQLLATNLKDRSNGLISQHRCQSTSASTTINNEASSTEELPKAMINDMENQEVLIDFNDGEAIRYPSFWLRDNCPCPVCRHPSTHQRQIDTFGIDPSVKIADINTTSDGVEVTWSQETTEKQQSPHSSLYPWTWLQTNTPFPSRIFSRSQLRVQRQWQHVPPSTPAASLPTVPFDLVMSTEDGIRNLINHIHTHGFCFISRTPATPEATEQLLNRIAFIRPTHYGAFWDFTSEANPIDTAYTDLELPLHTDNTYFTDPAGLQLFHCLSHVPSSSPNSHSSSSNDNDNGSDLGNLDPSLGGESTFSDGFATASQLYSANKQAYTNLSTYPTISSALGPSSSIGSFFNTASTSTGFPVFIHSSPHPSPTPSSLKPSTLTQIRWNNPDRSALTQFPTHQAMKSWYRSARLWDQALKQNQWEVKLGPGLPVIFDNWRILHGRKAFEGKRRVCGGYIGMDDFRARGRGLGLNM